MARIIIPGFKGGQTPNLYDSVQRQTYQKAYDLEVLTDSDILAPHKLKFQAANLPTVTGGSDIKIANSYGSSVGTNYFIGEAVITSAVNVVLWSTSDLGGSTTWTTLYNINTGTPGAVLEEYKKGIFFSWGTNLDRWGDITGSPSRTNISSGLDSVATHILNHTGLGKLFFVHGQKIGHYDNSTVTLAALTIDNSEVVVGIKPYGRFVVVGLRGLGSRRSRFIIWDGVSATFDDQIDLGDIGLQSFSIVNGEIRYVLTTSNTIGDSSIRRGYVVPGGRPQIFDEVPYRTSGASINANAVSSIGDVMLYGFNGPSFSIDLGIFAFGSANARNPKLHTLWRLVSTGVTSGVCIYSINATGSNIIVIWSTQSGTGTYHIDIISGLSITPAVPSTGRYTSDVFPMDGGLAIKPGTFDSIMMNHLPLPSSSGFSLWARQFGNYGMDGSVINSDDYFTFTVSGITVTPLVGATYTNNSSTYTVRYTFISGGVGYIITKRTTGTNSPSGSTLTKAAGTGDSSITFSDNTNFIPFVTDQGSGGITGATQSDNGASYTFIQTFIRLEKALYGQIEIRYDEVSGTNAPSVIFPIIIDTNNEDL